MEQNKLIEETPQYKAWMEWWTEMVEWWTEMNKQK